MAAGPGKSSFETERIQLVLDLIFAFFDQRESYQEATPPEINQAFALIVPYYNQRLCCLITPRRWDYLSGGAKPQDLHQEAWGKFWVYGADIKVRTVAGVYAWLRKVILNRIVDEKRKHLKLIEIEASEYWDTNPFSNRLARFMSDFDMLGGESKDEKQFRFALLCEFFQKALPELSTRQQIVIQFSQAGKTAAEITGLMGFPTKNAMSNFKRRAYQKLAHEIYRCFQREMQNTRADLLRKEIIATWLARFQKRGARKKCLIVTR